MREEIVDLVPAARAATAVVGVCRSLVESTEERRREEEEEERRGEERSRQRRGPRSSRWLIDTGNVVRKYMRA